MDIHNKISLAGELLVEAIKIYRHGETNIDFSKSILLAGAVIGIVAPYLEELGIKPTQIRLAELATSLRNIDLEQLKQTERKKEIAKSIKLYRMTYNSLKHAGESKKAPPSQDLTFEANLKEEAYYLIGHAIDDFKKIPFTPKQLNNEFSDDLLDLLQAFWP
ncbi:hypothetical protein [Aquabacterium sp.]|uniref:hypothetical protein n=1 Tax=Aquabacterium sp. TaxID=1872578 RepID=UPI00248A6CF4|nr:hypothetical protein [Aquabacterium sp.]MDI1349695.1 hypothetical protein [Aquabacterium sp.]